MTRPTFAFVLLAAALAAPGSAQRAVRQLSTVNQVHQTAKISPDGASVAFGGPGLIGIVNWSATVESPLVSGPNLGDFLWSRASSGLYFLDGSTLKFVSRGGGTPSTIASLPGQQHRLWSVDAQDRTLWGSRIDPASQNYSAFKIPTNGSTAPVDVATSASVIDEVKIDPTGTKVMYRTYVAQPFSPREYFSMNPDGTGVVSLTGGALTGNPELADWIDNGTTIAFAMVSQTTFQWQIAQARAGVPLTMLTEGTSARRNMSVSQDRQWITCQASYASGVGPAVMPSSGGGLVVLSQDDGTFYVFGSQSPPTFDSTGTKVAFTASVNGATSHVYGVELDRELRISPRAVIGSTFRVDMPIAQNELGVVFLGGALAAGPLSVPGFVGAFALDPLVLVTLTSGMSTSGALSVNVSLPNNPWFIGQVLPFQGARVLQSGAGGDFTRWAELRFF